MRIEYSDLESLNFQKLERKDLGNELNFTLVSTNIQNIQTKLLDTKKIYGKLTQNEQDVINKSFDNFKQIWIKIYEFQQHNEESINDSKNRRAAIVEEIKKCENYINQNLLSVINYYDNKRLAENYDEFPKNTLHSLKTEIGEKEKELNDIIKNAKIQLEEIEQIKQEKSIEKLSVQYGEIFLNQARNHRLLVISSVVFFLLSSIVGIFYIYNYILTIDTTITLEKSHDIIGKIFIVTIISIIIKESLRNFNIQMHLLTLNKHRHNVMLSFNKLLNTQINDTAKDNVAREVAKTIYSVNQIGYLNENKNTISQNQLIELIKTLRG